VWSFNLKFEKQIKTKLSVNILSSRNNWCANFKLFSSFGTKHYNVFCVIVDIACIFVLVNNCSVACET